VERDQLEQYIDDQFDMVLAFAGGSPIHVIRPAVLSGKH